MGSRVFCWLAATSLSCGPPEESCDVDLQFDLIDGPLCFAEPMVIDGAGFFDTFGDLDADGDVDFLKVEIDGIHVRWNDDGVPSSARLVPSTDFSDGVLPVQLDAEPGLELVAWGDDRLAILDFDEQRVPEIAQSYATTSPTVDDPLELGSQVGAGDFDGDGDADLLTSWGELVVWRNEGGLSLVPESLGDGAGEVIETSTIIVADVNGDGLDDAVVNTYDADENVQVLLGRAGALPEPFSTSLSAFASYGDALDIDQDGIDDAVGRRAYLRGRTDERWDERDIIDPEFGCWATLHVAERAYCVQFTAHWIDDEGYCGMAHAQAPDPGSTPTTFTSTDLVHPKLDVDAWLPPMDDARVSDKEHSDTPGVFADFDGDGRQDLLLRGDLSDALTVFLARPSCD